MCNCPESNHESTCRRSNAGATEVGALVRPTVPLARAVDFEPYPELEGTDAGHFPGPGLPGPGSPIGPIKACHLDLRDGCYEITHRPTGSAITLQGTLRVDRGAPDGGADRIIVSGDLYKKSMVVGPHASATGDSESDSVMSH